MRITQKRSQIVLSYPEVVINKCWIDHAADMSAANSRQVLPFSTTELAVLKPHNLQLATNVAMLAAERLAEK